MEAQAMIMDDLFVVSIERLSEKTIQRHTCGQELKNNEENNNEDVVDDVRNRFKEVLDDDDFDDEENKNIKKEKTVFKPTLGGAKKVITQPVKKNDELSDYEKIREKNMKDLRAKFLDELKKQAKALDDTKPTKPKKSAIRRKIIRRPQFKKIYGTRSRRNSSEPLEALDDKFNEKSSLLYEERRGTDDDDEEEYSPKRRRTHVHHHGHNPNEDIRSADSITEEDLANVADIVSEKVYSQNGTTCHQCRQKTTDMKTICRSGRCAGIRGYFCGICLKNRYGEDAREALKDPEWWCPPCLDICNCSICRNRLGKGATGPLTWLAQEKGFPSVKHYLESLMQRRGTDRFDED